MRQIALDILRDWNFTEGVSDRLIMYDQFIAGTIELNTQNRDYFLLVMAKSEDKILLHIKGWRGIWEQYIGKVDDPQIIPRLLCRAIADLNYRLS